MRIEKHIQYDYYINDKFYGHYCKIRDEKKAAESTLGKYLFFHSDRDKLILEVTKIAKHYKLSVFRVSTKSNLNGMYSYVAGIYDFKDNYSKDLRQYCIDNNLSSFYRFWKTQDKTNKKLYSKQFLNAKYDNR